MMQQINTHAARERKVQWQRGDAASMPYCATVDGQNWQIRLNDFPLEPMYSLLIDGLVVEDFDDWPQGWQR
jgi:hypothetical protein